MVYNFGGGLCSGYAGNPYFNGCSESARPAMALASQKNNIEKPSA